MDFEEQRVDAAADSCAHERLDVLAVARRGRAVAARQLDAVRAVKDDRIAEAAHDGEAPHIDDEVVIAERRAALRQQNLVAAALVELVDDVAHVVGREELALLDIDDAARLSSRMQEIRLAAEERRNLEDVRDFARRLRLIALMDVRHDGDAELLLDFREPFKAFFETRAAEAVERGTVRLVKRRLEDIVDAEALADAFDRAADQERAFEALEHAGARKQCERLIAANLEVSDGDFVHLSFSFHFAASAFLESISL